MIKVKSCPVCNSHNMEEYQKVGTVFRQAIVEIVPGIKVEVAPISCYFRCQKCRLIFQNPRMSDNELKIFSGQGYYRRTLDATAKEIDIDEARRAKINAVIIKKYVNRVSSHLDIGGSRGYLLDEVNADLKVNVEANEDYHKVFGAKVYQEISKVEQKSFDLVTAIHVLEHVPKPLEYLQQMVKLVSKGGCLVVEVPTNESPGGHLRLAHLYYFEPDVLKLMSKQVGLEVIHTEFTPHLLLICKLGEN